MLPEHSEIFRDLMIRLTGNLDISQALLNAFLPMRTVLPVDEIILARLVFDRDTISGMHAIIRANERGVIGEPDALLVEFDEEQKEDFRKRMINIAEIPFVSIGSPDSMPENKKEEILSSMGLPADCSTLVVLHKEVFGALVLISYQPNAYNESHVRLFEALKEGISIAISNAIRFLELKRSKEILIEDHQKMLAELQRDDQVVGAERGLKSAMALVRQVAPTQTPVLLFGETGTGKEVIAQAIHRASDRSAGPLISVNCGAIPESLVDSELFGHERGAFTGAVATNRGRFERANNGTLFLDEIGELPLSAQVRLLRVLQTKELERVGGNQPIRVNVRLIAATHRNLEEMVARGQFRDDLWFRLNVFPIAIPPLRERRDDIPLLAYSFVEAKSREMNLGARPPLLASEMDRLLAYDWPGNVRELQNAIERAIILCRGGPLSFPFLNADERDGAARQPEHPVVRAEATTFPTFDDAARTYIIAAVERAGGWISGPGGAAEIAGMNPSTFRSKMKKLGVSTSSPHRRARRP
ncbi:MAG: sigma 54-interacting transcriptional regulator [Deltaproteobacteria bacterium]|nr:sigma 54-interacting transcriptional regulator [Deltaproteobacteria bacterium]